MDGDVCYTRIASPVGGLLLVAGPEGLLRLVFQEGKRPLRPEAGWREAREPFAEAVRQLDAYFAGARTRFELPLAPRGTPFQQAVWRALQAIPYGETRSYGQVAAAIGRPTACRAVGAANGQNPLPILIPCHRVIGGDGSLTGFGGGLPAKRTLLALEQGGRLSAP